MKYILMILLTMSIGCKPIEILSIEKKIVFPGISSGSTKIKYTAKLITKENIKIKSVEFKNNSNQNLDFGIMNLSTYKLLNKTSNISKGDYSINLSVNYKEELKQSVDTLIFTFIKDNNKSKILEKETILLKPLLMK